MGVNIKDIERVCHYGIQEIGREGGRTSHGIIYYKSYHLAHCDESMKVLLKTQTTNAGVRLYLSISKQNLINANFGMTVVTFVLRNATVPSIPVNLHTQKKSLWIIKASQEW